MDHTLTPTPKDMFKSLKYLQNMHSFTYTQYKVYEFGKGKVLPAMVDDDGYVQGLHAVSSSEADMPLVLSLTFSNFMTHFRNSKNSLMYYLPWTTFSSFPIPDNIPNAEKYLTLHKPPELQFTPANMEQPLRQTAFETFFCQAHGQATLVLLDPLETKALYALNLANKPIGLSEMALDSIASKLATFQDRIKELHIKVVELKPSDCVYIPAFWWIASVTTSKSVQARYLYNPHSTWVDTTLRVVRHGEISPNIFESH